jgi:hypothetical protein
VAVFSIMIYEVAEKLALNGDQVRELITAETADLSSDDQAPLGAAGH